MFCSAQPVLIYKMSMFHFCMNTVSYSSKPFSLLSLLEAVWRRVFAVLLAELIQIATFAVLHGRGNFNV